MWPYFTVLTPYIAGLVPVSILDFVTEFDDARLPEQTRLGGPGSQGLKTAPL